MARYSIWMLEAVNITVSGGKSLSGITQGDGSHLVGETIRLDNRNLNEVDIRDRGGDVWFDDNDSNQRLDGAQTINGVSYGNSTRVEAEYQIVLEDPNTGIQYTAIGFNVNNSSPAYATVEGLAFVGPQGGFPPVGVDLNVVSAAEGPGDFGQPRIPAANFAFPVCFTPGTGIGTPFGNCAIETLRAADLVLTRDIGPQPVRWIGRTEIDPPTMATAPQFQPVRIERGA